MPSENQIPAPQNSSAVAITPELIKQVTEKVFALLLKDLKVEQERLQGTKNHFGRKGNRK